jgi:hypothetical protein
MNTKELTGTALDWAVAQCEGFDNGDWLPDYSTDWAAGGPIIEQEKIGLHYGDGTWGVDAGRWEANHPNCLYVEGGDTPLIAAMRCYVASCLGDEVQLPEELK